MLLGMKKSWVVVILSLVFVLAGVLRVSDLSFVKGVTPDEVQQGYSAYSILKTGSDEWGDFLPVFPRSFGDYRPSLYLYLTVPFVALFDLNLDSMRMASAIFGSLTVIVLFFLGKEIFGDQRVGILASLFLAIAYWHVFYSRSAWESNVAVFFFLTGILFFLKGLEKKTFLIASAIFLGVSLFGYYSFKLLTPLFVYGGSYLFRKEFRVKKGLIIFISMFSIFLVIMVGGDIFSGGSRRAEDTSIFNSENLMPLRETQIKDFSPQPLGRIINNRVAYLLSQFSQNYFGYFSTTFFVSPNRSDSSLYNLPGEWLVSIWEFLLVLLALYVLILKKFPGKLKLIPFLILIIPLPAALTRDYLHTQRVETLLFLLPLLAAFGAVFLFDFIKSRNLRLIGSLILVGLISYSLIYRIDHYIFHQFNKPLGGVHYGYDQIFDYTEKNKGDYEKIIFTKQQSEPQIFLAFYSKMDPLTFQSYSKDWKGFEKEGFKFLDMTNYNLDKYQFKNIDWDKDKRFKNRLVVGTDSELPDELKVKYQVKDPFGNVLFNAIDTNDF